MQNGGNGALPQDIAIGAVSMATVNQAVTRALTKRFLTGQFDPLQGQVYLFASRSVFATTAIGTLRLGRR